MVTIVAIAILAAILNVGFVHAQTLILTPNPVTQGTSVQVTGSDFQQDENAQIQLFQLSAGTCSVFPAMTLDASTDSNGNLNPVTIPTSGLAAGTYCVEGNGFLDSPETVDLVVNPGTASTTAASPQIPGFPIEAIFIGIILGLVVIVISRRRKSSPD